MKGSENQVADSLSRVVEFMYITVSIPYAEWWDQLKAGIFRDQFYSQLGSNPLFTLRDGVWFQQATIYLNVASPLVPKILVSITHW